MTNLLDALIGILFILLAALLFITFSLQRKRRVFFRTIPTIQNLRKTISQSIEDGKRLHLSLGNASLLSPNNASALASLATLNRIASLTVQSDRLPVATSGDGGLAMLSQDTIWSAYKACDAGWLYHHSQGRLTGVGAFPYLAGAMVISQHEEVSSNILAGHFGPEVALLCSAAEQEDAFHVGTSNMLPAQAALYACAKEPLIGEELFALPAYLKAGPIHLASVRVQDTLRWLIIFFLLAGAVLKLLGLSITGEWLP